MGNYQALRAEILVHQVVLVQVGQLIKQLACDLRDFHLGEGLSQVAQVVQIVLAVVLVLVNDVYVILRMENVLVRLHVL